MELYSEPDLDYEALFGNHHRGEVGVLIGNGPSLEQVPPELLTKYPTMGMNRITLMVPKFVPTYYLCIGINHFKTPEMRDTMKPLISHPTCQAAFIQRMWSWWYPWKKVIATMGTHPYYGQPMGAPSFSIKPQMCLGTSTNSAYPCLQVMFWLGFETVLLVGFDHHYPEGTKKHFYEDSEAPGFAVGSGDYTNEVWEDVSNERLAIARTVYDQYDRQILNLTEGSHCTAFEFDKPENWQ